MWFVYYVVGLCGFLPISESLECFHCSNATSTKDCSSKMTCPQGQKCYTSSHGVGASQTFDLGCRAENDCLQNGGPIFVGRSTESQSTCAQCCQVDDCNGQLCSIGLQVINEVGQCTDDPAFDCATISTAFNICGDVHHAKVKCRKYCGLCTLVDGSWSFWSSWSHCDVTCGSGHMTRTRTCSNPVPVHGGLDCVGDSKEISACVTDVCPVHGGWSLWSPWGYCSVTCGIGLERRDRSCSNPYPSRGGDNCYGDSRDDRPCFVKACADGLWSAWSSWGSCSASCLGGLQKRTRTCDNPAPTNFGHTCVGTNQEYQSCNNKECSHGMPVLFRAQTVSNRGGSSEQALIYTDTKINEGGGYDNTTGIFTAPDSGMYMFDVQTCVGIAVSVIVYVVIDGHHENSMYLYNQDRWVCHSMNVLVSLDTGNRVWVTVPSSNHVVQNGAYLINMFQGVKIGV